MQLPVFKDSGLLTNTSEGTWRVCNRKYYLRYVLGLRKVHEAEALRMGQVYHLGLDCFKQQMTVEEAEWNIRQAYKEVPCPVSLSLEQYDVEKEKVVAMVKAYYHRYVTDPIVKYLVSELEFKMPIMAPECDWPMHTLEQAGKIDGIAELPDGRLAIVEHKTTADAIDGESEYWDTLLMDYQLSRYFLAAQELGYKVETIVYDVVRKPQIKPKQILKTERQRATFNKQYFGIKLDDMCPDHETPKMYGARLYHDMTAERPSFYFARREITRLLADIESYRKEQWATASQILQAEAMREDLGIHAYPRNTKSCTSYGLCPYFQICRGLLGNPEEAVPAGFRTSEILHPELGDDEKTGIHEGLEKS